MTWKPRTIGITTTNKKDKMRIHDFRVFIFSEYFHTLHRLDSNGQYSLEVWNGVNNIDEANFILETYYK